MVASWLERSSPDRAAGPGSSPGRGHCVVFLDKTLGTLGACGTGEFNAGGNPADGLASHPGGSRNTPGHLMLLKPG